MKTPAERQKLKRYRDRHRLTPAVVEVEPIFLDYLISIGSIAPAKTVDRVALGKAIKEWAWIMMAKDLEGS